MGWGDLYRADGGPGVLPVPAVRNAGKAAYSVDEDGQVTLSEDNGAVLLYAGQRLWYVRDGQAAPYEKMSDQAVFINVEEEG